MDYRLRHLRIIDEGLDIGLRGLVKKGLSMELLKHEDDEITVIFNFYKLLDSPVTRCFTSIGGI